jgi:hypothetical protein
VSTRRPPYLRVRHVVIIGGASGIGCTNHREEGLGSRRTPAVTLPASPYHASLA